MLFSEKENVFMCLVAFQKMFRKIFSDVWLCSWKYHRKHIFYLLLTFSHIFSVTKRIYNIIYFSKYKQNQEKNHQIQTNDRRDRDRSGQRFAQSRSHEALIAIGAFARCVNRAKIDSSGEDRSVNRDRDWGYCGSRWCQRTMMSRSILSFSLSFSLSLSLSLSLLFSKAGSNLKWK